MLRLVPWAAVLSIVGLLATPSMAVVSPGDGHAVERAIEHGAAEPMIGDPDDQDPEDLPTPDRDQPEPGSDEGPIAPSDDQDEESRDDDAAAPEDAEEQGERDEAIRHSEQEQPAEAVGVVDGSFCSAGFWSLSDDLALHGVSSRGELSGSVSGWFLSEDDAPAVDALAIHPDGETAYAAELTDEGVVIKSFRAASGATEDVATSSVAIARPTAGAVDSAGTHYYFGSFDGDAFELYAMNLGDNAVSHHGRIMLGGAVDAYGGDIAFDAQGNLLILVSGGGIAEVPAGDNEGLTGAVFEVYPAADPYATECAAEPLADATPITVNGEAQFESTDGDILVQGLFVSDSENDPTNALYRCYVLKEVKAPAGYVLPEGDEALFAVAVETGTTTGFDIVVPNVKQDVPDLPLTGGQLQVGLMILGGALLVGGLTFAKIARRRRAQA